MYSCIYIYNEATARLNPSPPSVAYASVNCVNIGADNGLSPGRRQGTIWTKTGLLLIEPLGTNFGEILFDIRTFLIKEMHLKMSSAKWRPFCPWRDELSDLTAGDSIRAVQGDWKCLIYLRKLI